MIHFLHVQYYACLCFCDWSNVPSIQREPFVYNLVCLLLGCRPCYLNFKFIQIREGELHGVLFVVNDWVLCGTVINQDAIIKRFRINLASHILIQGPIDWGEFEGLYIVDYVVWRDCLQESVYTACVYTMHVHACTCTSTSCKTDHYLLYCKVNLPHLGHVLISNWDTSNKCVNCRAQKEHMMLLSMSNVCLHCAGIPLSRDVSINWQGCKW